MFQTTSLIVDRGTSMMKSARITECAIATLVPHAKLALLSIFGFYICKHCTLPLPFVLPFRFSCFPFALPLEKLGDSIAELLEEV